MQKLKSEIIISKTANKYFYVANLSEWSHLYRKKYNIAWLKDTKELTLKEKEALATFKNIHQKYPYRSPKNKRGYLAVPFFNINEKEVWEDVKNLVTKKELQELKKIFEIFEKKTDKLWEQYKDNIFSWREFIQEEIKNLDIESIFENLSILYNTHPKSSKLSIYLIANPINVFSANASLGKERLILECPKISNKIKTQLLPLLFHELIHIYFDKDKLKPELVNFINKINPKKYRNHPVYKEAEYLYPILNESIAGSLFPAGHLGEKYFKVKTNNYYQPIKQFENPKNFYNCRRWVSYNLLDLAKEYIENKKTLDLKYIKTTYNLFQKFRDTP